MTLRNILAMIAIAISYHVRGQVSSPTSTSYTTVAKSSLASDGTLVIEANHPRPLWQVLECVKRRYGWVVDYEDPVYAPELVTSDRAHGSYPRGGSFTAHITEPHDNSLQEERRVLHSVVNQFNAGSQTKYRVVQVSGTRFDISPATDSQLDRPIKIDSEERSLREELDAILLAFTETTGMKARQGGFMNNIMEQTMVSLNHSSSVSARQLINEVLDHAPVQMSYIFTYSPDNSGSFGLGVQVAEKWTTDSSGKTKVQPILNSTYIHSKK